MAFLPVIITGFKADETKKSVQSFCERRRSPYMFWGRPVRIFPIDVFTVQQFMMENDLCKYIIYFFVFVFFYFNFFIWNVVTGLFFVYFEAWLNEVSSKHLLYLNFHIGKSLDWSVDHFFVHSGSRHFLAFLIFLSQWWALVIKNYFIIFKFRGEKISRSFLILVCLFCNAFRDWGKKHLGIQILRLAENVSLLKKTGFLVYQP